MPPPVRLVWDDAALSRLLTSPTGPAAQLTVRIGGMVLQRVDQHIHSRTGRTVRLTRLQTGVDGRGFYVDVVAPFWLRFVSRGTRHTRPQHVLEQALQDVRRALS